MKTVKVRQKKKKTKNLFDEMERRHKCLYPKTCFQQCSLPLLVFDLMCEIHDIKDPQCTTFLDRTPSHFWFNVWERSSGMFLLVFLFSLPRKRKNIHGFNYFYFIESRVWKTIKRYVIYIPVYLGETLILEKTDRKHNWDILCTK